LINFDIDELMMMVSHSHTHLHICTHAYIDKQNVKRSRDEMSCLLTLTVVVLVVRLFSVLWPKLTTTLSFIMGISIGKGIGIGYCQKLSHPEQSSLKTFVSLLTEPK